MSSKGFTLVELVVAVGLASVILTSLLLFFLSFISGQVRAQDERVALETIRFFISDLSRELYFGRDFECGWESAGACRCLKFTDQLGRKVKVRYPRYATGSKGFLDRSVRRLDSRSGCRDIDGDWIPLTDDSVHITGVDFQIDGDSSDTEQPRVRMQVDAEYVIGDSVTKSVSFKTQVTRRILEPSQTALATIVADIDERSLSRQYYAYGPRVNSRGQYVDDGGNVVSAPVIVCQDEIRQEFADRFCDDPVKPVAVEFTTDGLYLLGDNGLLFLLPQASITSALRASGAVGAVSPVYVTTSSVQSALVRVVGLSGVGNTKCRFCPSDPRNIVSIHPAGSFLYAVSYTGALFKISGSSSTLLLSGGVGKNTVRHIDADAKRALLLYRDEGGKRRLRLWTGGSLTVASVNGVSPTPSCSVFAYLPSSVTASSSLVCREISPDASSSPFVSPSEIADINLSLVNRVQVVSGNNNAVNHLSVWYSDGGVRKVRTVFGTSGNHLRSGDTLARSDGLVVYDSVSPAGFTYICDDSQKLCHVASINAATVTSSNALTDTLTDHFRLQGFPIGVSGVGQLVFSNSTVSTISPVSVYNASESPTNPQRVLCGATSENSRQVSFRYASDKHPNNNLVALLGKVLVAGEGYATEVYLLEPRATKNRYTGAELSTLCGATDYIERHYLPTSSGGPSGGLDLLRLRGMVLRDVPYGRP